MILPVKGVIKKKERACLEILEEDLRQDAPEDERRLQWDQQELSTDDECCEHVCTESWCAATGENSKIQPLLPTQSRQDPTVFQIMMEQFYSSIMIYLISISTWVHETWTSWRWGSWWTNWMKLLQTVFLVFCDQVSSLMFELCTWWELGTSWTHPDSDRTVTPMIEIKYEESG